jgi:hypothetical protein
MEFLAAAFITRSLEMVLERFIAQVMKEGTVI